MSTYVLIHGNWHDGTHWNSVATELRAVGHEVHAPTIAGHGKNVDKNVTHDDGVRSIVEYYEANDLKDTILLGHSYGGTIVARVSEEIPDRIHRLVFWNAFIPEAGNSVLDEVPPHYRALFSHLVTQSEDNTVMVPFQIWRDNFIQDAELEIARSTYESLSSEPWQPLIDKLPLDRFYATSLPKSFINGTEDTALPPGEWGWHPRMSSRLGGPRLIQLPGSHELLLTNPSLLAKKIIEAGRD